MLTSPFCFVSELPRRAASLPCERVFDALVHAAAARRGRMPMDSPRAVFVEDGKFDVPAKKSAAATRDASHGPLCSHKMPSFLWSLR